MNSRLGVRCSPAIKKWAKILAASLITGLTSCTSLDVRPPEEQVGERALSQARALLQGDYEAAVQFTAPSYRDSDQARFYQARHAGAQFWIDVELRWVKCDEGPEPDRCSVRIWIYNNPPLASGRANSRSRGNDVPISWDKVWIKFENQWYQYP